MTDAAIAKKMAVTYKNLQEETKVTTTVKKANDNTKSKNQNTKKDNSK
jgi:hypothetical protein